VRARGILAALVALLLLSVSAFSAACDLSCAFGAFSSHCDQANRTAGRMDMSMPMQMDGMNHADRPMQSEMAQTETPTIRVSSNMKPCQHQRCDKPATVIARRIAPADPQISHVLPAVVGNPDSVNVFAALHHPQPIRLGLNLSALDPLLTSLRI
jgi:hypothetical protein